MIRESGDGINESKYDSKYVSDLYKLYGNKYKIRKGRDPMRYPNWRNHINYDYRTFPMPCRYVGIIAIDKYGEKPNEDGDNLWWMPLKNPEDETDAMNLL